MLKGIFFKYVVSEVLVFLFWFKETKKRGKIPNLEPLNLCYSEPCVSKIGDVKKKYFFFTSPIFQIRI